MNDEDKSILELAKEHRDKVLEKFEYSFWKSFFVKLNPRGGREY